MKEMLFARDIARIRGVNVSSARRWLHRLEQLHGASVVGRWGERKLFTTPEALARVAPAIRDQSRIEARLTDLELRLADLERRADEAARKNAVLLEGVRRLQER